MIKLNEYAIKAAIANNRLEGHMVTLDMITKLEEALNNTNISKQEIVAYILKEDLREVKVPTDIEGNNRIL
jgi:hypothetical protein